MSKSMSMSGEEAKIALGKAFEAHDRMVIRVAALTAQVEALTAQRDEAVRLLSPSWLADALSQEAWDEWHEARYAWLDQAQGVGQ